MLGLGGGGGAQAMQKWPRLLWDRGMEWGRRQALHHPYDHLQNLMDRAASQLSKAGWHQLGVKKGRGMRKNGEKLEGTEEEQGEREAPVSLFPAPPPPLLPPVPLWTGPYDQCQNVY